MNKIPTLDTTVRPQDDFFAYVNNDWLAKNPLPASESRWGTFNVLRDKAWLAMKTMYTELLDAKNVKPGSTEQQARDLFYTGLNNDTFEAAHLEIVKDYLKKIDAIKNTLDLASTIGELQAIGVRGPWRVVVDLDEKDSTQHIFRLHQTDLTLPDRDYYLEDSEKYKTIRKEYAKHLQKVRTLFTDLAPSEKAFSETIIGFETELAKISRSQSALRDVEANYNKVTYADLQKTYAHINWPAFAKATGWKPSDQISVDQPEFLAFINQQFKTRLLDDWKTYLKWQFLQMFYSHISERFAALKFEFFGKVLSGTSELMPKWKRVTLMVDEVLGDAVGRLYVERHFGESAKNQVLDMVELVRDTYKTRIQNLNWMSEPTKAEALKKLANMKVLIGYPDKWRDFSGLKIGRESYIANIIAGEKFANDYWLAKLGQPASRDEWLMYPQTVNAYHDPNRLVICFPAAILQPPFFDPLGDLATNLGGIGTVIGHEFTHGFDDQGCQFDERGNVRMWQTPADRKAFEKRAQIIIDQADNFEVLPGVNLKGKLVIGESIADLGGLELAHNALQTKLGDRINQETDGLTHSQRFFIGYATTECGHTRPEKLREFAVSDPHPNEHFRVNAILQHVDAFVQAFNLKLGDKLYRRSGERARIW